MDVDGKIFKCNVETEYEMSDEECGKCKCKRFIRFFFLTVVLSTLMIILALFGIDVENQFSMNDIKTILTLLLFKNESVLLNDTLKIKF